ncbi:MAG TPA: hypothetical protein PLU30_25455 [Verrucomicrobiae bacterium]|nr:hypothetical protein [Verrucomicrobiae bacterium]
MAKISFDDAVARIVTVDGRYAPDAYRFVKESLDYTIKTQKRRRSRHAEPQHVSGNELLEGIRRHALEEFGPMARTIFEHWGVHRCEDFGEIVFNLVDSGIFGKTESDSRADFQGGYSFEEAFDKPFRPTRPLLTRRCLGRPDTARPAKPAKRSVSKRTPSSPQGS